MADVIAGDPFPGTEIATEMLIAQREFLLKVARAETKRKKAEAKLKKQEDQEGGNRQRRK